MSEAINIIGHAAPGDPGALPQDALPIALPRATRIQHLINRINAHEAEGALIDAERLELDLSPRDIKKIQATQRTLAALMEGGLVPERAKQ